MSNYQKLDDFDIHWVKKLTFVQIRNNLIFIKKSPWTPMSQLSPVCTFCLQQYLIYVYNFDLGTIYRLAGHIFYHRYCCDMRQCDTKVKFGIYHSVSPAKILVLTFFLLLLYTIVQGVSKTEIYLFIFIFCTIAQSFQIGTRKK